ncbi:formylglycine-generating enzyme family protein [Flammeovirga yaeyamensis]
MVYVPQGAYHLGSGGNEKGHFYKYNGSTDTDTYYVDSENSITIGNQSNNLYYDTASINHQGDQTGVLSESFPKGYNAFYCMKYEITQAQFTAFLSTIDFDDATNLIRKQEKGRNLIVNTDSVVYSDQPYVPIQYLSWQGLAAYLDWAALRPITELEFEKACRGTQTPVPNEYVWGNTLLNENDYTTVNEDTKSESISSNFSMNTGNANYKKNSNGTYKPYRTGKFSGYSTGASLTRVQAGATYYGIMEMSGNVSEKVVTVGHEKGRVFTGEHGDGHLCPDVGLADVENWPCNDTALGSGVRGGSYNRSKNLLETSNRKLAARNYYQEYRQLGGRGGRTAPTE